MNKEGHFTGTVILLLILFFVFDYLGLDRYIQYLLFMFFTATLPDFIEPAFNYKHRQYFHSKSFAKILGALFVVSFVAGFLIEWVNIFAFLIVGYLFHLFLDSTTPMGLPKK